TLSCPILVLSVARASARALRPRPHPRPAVLIGGRSGARSVMIVVGGVGVVGLPDGDDVLEDVLEDARGRPDAVDGADDVLGVEVEGGAGLLLVDLPAPADDVLAGVVGPLAREGAAAEAVDHRVVGAAGQVEERDDRAVLLHMPRLFHVDRDAV